LLANVTSGSAAAAAAKPVNFKNDLREQSGTLSLNGRMLISTDAALDSGIKETFANRVSISS
jgi:hypothetical protein